MEQAEKQRNQWNYGSGGSTQMMSAMKFMKIAESSAAIYNPSSPYRDGKISQRGAVNTNIKAPDQNLNCLGSLES